MEWVVLGGICVFLVAFDFAKHVYYVAKNVWPMRRAFNKPTRTLPAVGVVTINGIVSGMGEECPVQIKLREDGHTSRGQVYWKQTSRVVEAHPFALLVPDAGARIIVEPGDDVKLRASAHVTAWEYNEKIGKRNRFRIGALEDGDRAIVTGVLTEKREIEKQASEYRSQKGKVRIEYVLRPIPGEPLRIDSETMFDEINERLGYIGWVRALGTIILHYYYVKALMAYYDVRAHGDEFAARSAKVYAAVVIVYAVIRLFMQGGKRDRLPWFDRHKSSRNPYYSVEDYKHSERSI